MKRPEGFDRNVPETPAGARPPRSAGRSEKRKQTGRPQGTGASQPRGNAQKKAGITPAAPRTTGAAEAGTARELRLARRRRRRYEREEIRRFTRRARNRRRAWLVVLGGAATFAILLAVAVYSPVLALRSITVDGTSRVDADEVVAAIDGQLGTPLALLDYSQLREQLGAFPLIRSFVTEAVPPGTLVVHIVERQPVGAIASGSGFALVDPAGIVVESPAERPAGVPLIDVGASGAHGAEFDAVVQVLLALPESVRGQVDRASATSRDDVTLVLSGVGQRVVWGSAEQAELKARVLQALITAQDPAVRVEYDVTAPLSPVVRRP